MNFYLVRHCLVPRQGVCYGRSDVVAQALSDCERKRLLSSLPEASAMLKFSSPLSRCQALANVLWADASSDDRLAELDFGVWEGVPWDDISREALDQWAASPLMFSPPGGESFKALIRRVALWRRDACLRAREQGLDHVAAVSHAGVIKAMAVLCNGVSVAQALAMQVPYAEVLHFR